MYVVAMNVRMTAVGKFQQSCGLVENTTANCGTFDIDAIFVPITATLRTLPEELIESDRMLQL